MTHPFGQNNIFRDFALPTQKPPIYDNGTIACIIGNCSSINNIALNFFYTPRDCQGTQIARIGESPPPDRLNTFFHVDDKQIGTIAE